MIFYDFLKEMSTRSRNTHVNYVSSELKQILLHSGAANTNSTRIHEANLAVQLVRASRIDDLPRGIPDVWPKTIVDRRVEEEPQEECIDEEKQIPESDSRNECGYSGPAHEVVRPLIREAGK